MVSSRRWCRWSCVGSYSPSGLDPVPPDSPVVVSGEGREGSRSVGSDSRVVSPRTPFYFEDPAPPTLCPGCPGARADWSAVPTEESVTGPRDGLAGGCLRKGAPRVDWYFLGDGSLRMSGVGRVSQSHGHTGSGEGVGMPGGPRVESLVTWDEVPGPKTGRTGGRNSEWENRRTLGHREGGCTSGPFPRKSRVGW